MVKDGGGTRDRRDSGFQEKYGKMSASYEADRSMSGYGTTGRRESGGGQRREAGGGGMDQATPASRKDDFSRSVANDAVVVYHVKT